LAGLDQPLIAAFYTDLRRTRQTIDTAMAEIGELAAFEIIGEPRFGFRYAEDPRHPFPGNSGVSAADWRAQDPRDWLERWPVCREIKGGFTATLLHWACYFGNAGDKSDDVNILIGSHSPTGELAAIEVGVFGLLWEADIVRYAIEMSGWGFGRIVGAEFLRCPID